MENTTNNTQKANQPQDANVQPPNNYLVWAILSLFLCLPFGIVSLVKSNQVNQKWNAGDFEGAKKSSQEALKYAKWSLYVAIIMWVIFLFAMPRLKESQIFESF